MKTALTKLKSAVSGAPSIANSVIKKVTGELNTTLDSETSRKLKDQTINAVKVASSVAKNLGDLNGDGKIDKEDLKYAAEKAGFVWDKIDSDLKEALLFGGMAGIGINAIPFIGQFVAVPVFATATAGYFVKAKIHSMSVKKIINRENNKSSLE